MASVTSTSILKKLHSSGLLTDEQKIAALKRTGKDALFKGNVVEWARN